MLLKKGIVLLALSAIYAFAAAKPQPMQVLVRPQSGPPLVKFELGKFQKVGSYSGNNAWVSNVVAENAWNKRVQVADFAVYFYDKDKVRIGEGYIQVRDLAPGAKTKFDLNVTTAGMPAAIELAPRQVPDEFQHLLPPKTIAITINSVPQGAALQVDRVEAGSTPTTIQVLPGKHVLTFAMSGYSTGTYPLEVRPNDASGGSISFELGSAMHDTVELRDGTVLTGDVERMDATMVEIRLGGQVQSFDRNKVKRMLLIERQPPTAAVK